MNYYKFASVMNKVLLPCCSILRFIIIQYFNGLLTNKKPLSKSPDDIPMISRNIHCVGHPYVILIIYLSDIILVIYLRAASKEKNSWATALNLSFLYSRYSPYVSQQTFTCSKLTTETLRKYVQYVQS